MNIFLIIIIIILVILIVPYIIGLILNRKIVSPIDSIEHNGCLGFKIGDSKAFVLSRIKHLKLMTDEDKERIEMYEKMGVENSIRTSTGLFNNIESITFRFDRLNRLSSIFIPVIPQQTDLPSLFNIIKRTFDSRLGDTSSEYESIRSWKKYNNVVSVGFIKERNSLYISISAL